MHRFNPSFKFLLFLSAIAFLLVAALPFQAAASDDIDQLKQEVKTLQKKSKSWRKRAHGTKMTLKTCPSGWIRPRCTPQATRFHSASTSAQRRNPSITTICAGRRRRLWALVGAFFTPVSMGGFNGATLEQMQTAIGGMIASGQLPPAEKYDADNNIIYTNKFRLNMKAMLNRHVNFAGRLAAYKVFGDSTGVKFNQGSPGDVTFDGNTSSLPHGDTIRLERAYLVYQNDISDDVHWHLSLGRRPSTDGPPLEYANYDLVGGSPLGHIINWQFDGASLGFNFGDAIGFPGASFKFCYGAAFENDYGNSSTLGYNGSDLTDVHISEDILIA